jgi:hypothetical protein
MSAVAASSIENSKKKTRKAKTARAFPRRFALLFLFKKNA